MKRVILLTVPLVFALACSAPSQGAAAPRKPAPAFTCEKAPKPIVTLTYGSRYTKDSKSRSDIDAASNAEVDAQLKPVETLIGYLSRVSNAAMFSEADRPARVACVANLLEVWAKANALSDLGTLNANLSVAPRLAGLAVAMLQADRAGKIDPVVRNAVVVWFSERAKATMSFFDSDPQLMATKNNLRAWAGYGVGAIGLLANDESMKEWARGSFKLVACAANPDGSLPLEMRRADRALNYQIHAVSPLVMTAVMLGSASFDGFSECNGALRKIVDFTLAAAKDPAIVEKINGKPQVFNAGDQVHDPFTMAWAEPYLAHVKDPALNAYVAPLRPLMNSKLGGNLTKIYGKNS